MHKKVPGAIVLKLSQASRVSEAEGLIAKGLLLHTAEYEDESGALK